MSAGSSLRPLVGYLQQLAGQSVHAETSDRQLLERFARERDEDAFRTLVQRHGPLVLGVCRRALRHSQDAEDCFQATFLVLARKAGAVRWHESAVGWLHQVASRLAAEIRVRNARRRRREQAAATRSGANEPAGLCEVGAALDEELRRLPDRCRDALLRCYLQGQPRDQAALQLGLSLRTLERRLHHARELLRVRLTRRGLTLSAGLLAWGIAQDASSAVPPGLAAVTARAAAGWEAALPRAAALAAWVMRALLWEKMRGVAGVLLVLGLLSAGAGLRVASPADAPATVPAPVQQEAPKAPAARAKLQEIGTAMAVDRGLRWLMRGQTAEGGWVLDGATPNAVAATAFGLLPLLEARQGGERLAPRDAAVRRGLKFLAAMQKADGGFEGGMYAHGLATLALCEGYRLTADPTLKQPAQRAVDYLVTAQHAAGGWRYAPGQPGDTSVTSWQVPALKRGERAGLKVPAAVFKKASAYLDSVASDDGAAYGYVQAGQGTAAMTAAGLMSRQLLGWEGRNPAMLKGAARLKQASPAPGLANAYYYHFATRAMQGVGGAEWEAWEAELARMLLGRQQRDGSWDPLGDPFANAGGRLMTTSLSLLALQTCGRLEVPAGAARALKDGEAAERWAELADSDVAKVRRAMVALAAAPRQSVPLLRARLRPVPAPDAKRLGRLIADLGNDDFETRTAAFRKLQGVGAEAEPALRQALKSASALELRRRLEQLLAVLEREAMAPDRLRQLRVVQVLELTGSAEARQALEVLARGAPGMAVTQAAQAALGRLGERAAP